MNKTFLDIKGLDMETEILEITEYLCFLGFTLSINIDEEKLNYLTGRFKGLQNPGIITCGSDSSPDKSYDKIIYLGNHEVYDNVKCNYEVVFNSKLGLIFIGDIMPTQSGLPIVALAKDADADSFESECINFFGEKPEILHYLNKANSFSMKASRNACHYKIFPTLEYIVFAEQILSNPDDFVHYLSGEITPYNGIAGLYDFLMEHVDYHDWAKFVKRIFKTFDVSGGKILEMGAGTGSITEALTDVLGNGYTYDVSDLSPAMLSHARYKLMDYNNIEHFFLLDAVDINIEMKYDAIIFLHDSINYLTTEDDLHAFFEGVKKLLHEKSYLIFDISTLKNSRVFFSDEVFFEELEGLKYVRDASFDKSTNMQSNNFTIFVENGLNWDCHYEEHRQRIYSLRDMLHAIKKAGLKVHRYYHDFTGSEGSEESLRITFVLGL